MKTEFLCKGLIEQDLNSTRHYQEPRKPRRNLPLAVRVLLGVVLGAIVGLLFGDQTALLGIGTKSLGQLGMILIKVLKAVAVPLVFFAVVDALLRTRVTAAHAHKLLAICAINVSVAFVIALALMNWVEPGVPFRGHLEQLVTSVKDAPVATRSTPGGATLNPLKNLESFIPPTPNIVTVVLVALLMGASLRRVKEKNEVVTKDGTEIVGRAVEAVYQAMLQIIEWVIQFVPFAVFGVVAQVVGRSGLAPFAALGTFVAVILVGMALHSLGYYVFIAWKFGGRPPRVFLGQGADAILTGISTNSSLATVPITLRCLTDKMGVSQRSARLSACMGTNLNNDGITLYEAMAAIFLAQACGFELTLTQQGVIILASLMAGIGVAGVPEAGLIVLPLVLSAAGLPEATVVAAIPLLLSVDWLLARARSGVNVMSDMLVAILLDRGTVHDSHSNASPTDH